MMSCGRERLSGAKLMTVVRAEPSEADGGDYFELDLAAQEFIPGTEEVISAKMDERGLQYRIGQELPTVIEANIERFCRRLMAAAVGVRDYNEMCWVVHASGPAILGKIEGLFGLKEGKLEASRRVLREYGNLGSNTVLFVMEKMIEELRRKKMEGEEAAEWGLVLGFGPGVTFDPNPAQVIGNLVIGMCG